MQPHHYQVRIGKEHLVFCCGHFISYHGHQCERLHGHNYRAAIEVEAPLSEDFYAIDFVTLTRLAKEITDALDHHMLLPAHNPVIAVKTVDAQVHVTYQERAWSFPKVDCVILPIENTTAELLAKYICERLLASLQAADQPLPHAIRIEVEENVGQSATYEQRLALS